MSSAFSKRHHDVTCLPLFFLEEALTEGHGLSIDDSTAEAYCTAANALCVNEAFMLMGHQALIAYFSFHKQLLIDAFSKCSHFHYVSVDSLMSISRGITLEC